MLIPIFWGRHYYRHSTVDEGWGLEKKSNLSKITQVCLTLKAVFFHQPFHKNDAILNQNLCVHHYIKEKNCLEISSGSWRLTVFSSRCFALISLPLTLQRWWPLFGGYDGDGQMTVFSLFTSTDFSSLHFLKTFLGHRERKYIKYSYSCCEPGSQKGTSKGYLHAHTVRLSSSHSILHI